MVQSYGEDVLNGLAFLHAEEVAHRDVTMANILFDPRANAMAISDFCMAASASDFVIGRTVTGLWYRAPEALLDIQQMPCSQSALDLWSVGVLLAALACGCFWFRGSEVQDVFAKHVKLLGSQFVAPVLVVFHPGVPR